MSKAGEIGNYLAISIILITLLGVTCWGVCVMWAALIEKHYDMFFGMLFFLLCFVSVGLMAIGV